MKVAALAPIASGLATAGGLSATTAAAIGAGVSALGLGAQAYSSQRKNKAQEKLYNQQSRSNQQWEKYQNERRDHFAALEDQKRADAEARLDENLETQTEEAAQETVDTEAASLADAFAAGVPASPDDIRLSGQDAGQSKVFDAELASKLSDATASAKDRIAAMAKATAYGGGSMGGLGLTTQLGNMDAATDINALNDERRGNLMSGSRYTTVSPMIHGYADPSGTAFLEGLGTLGTQVGGSMLGANIGDAFAGSAPATSPIPVPRPVGAATTVNPYAPGMSPLPLPRPQFGAMGQAGFTNGTQF